MKTYKFSVNNHKKNANCHRNYFIKVESTLSEKVDSWNCPALQKYFINLYHSQLSLGHQSTQVGENKETNEWMAKVKPGLFKRLVPISRKATKNLKIQKFGKTGCSFAKKKKKKKKSHFDAPNHLHASVSMTISPFPANLKMSKKRPLSYPIVEMPKFSFNFRWNLV